MQAIIKEHGERVREFNYSLMNWIRIDAGNMTINYIDENGEEHQETGKVPDYMLVCRWPKCPAFQKIRKGEITMGYRMNIWPDGREDESVGDDHKFYGYADYENVKSSFKYLFDTALSKMDEFDIYLEFENPAKEAYDTFCCYGCSPGIVLTSKEFEVFSTLYLGDLASGKPDNTQKLTPEWFNEISGYMHEMCKTPGNKVLQWL